MEDIKIKRRIVNKHDTAENWAKATNFIPLNAELIVYDPDEEYSYPRFKIGDGITNVNSLPFIGNVGQLTEYSGEIFNSYNNNNAFGPFTHAEGWQSSSGIKGYYFTKLELNENKTSAIFYLSKEQTAAEMTEDTRDLNFSIDYAINDIISYVSGAKHLDVGKISAIDNELKTITVTALSNKTLEKGAYDTGVDDQIIYVLNKPTVGVAHFGHYAHAEGEETYAVERSSHAEGRKTVARGQYGHAEGRQTVAHYAAHAEGYLSEALNTYAHAEGWDTEATGSGSHAEGRLSKAVGQFSHAEGSNTQAIGFNSHVEGNNTIASNINAHAEGFYTEASGEHSHSEGVLSKSTGSGSHAEGMSTEASGGNSHSEGISSKSTAAASHAEGNSTTAAGDNSHAEGTQTQALSHSAHAEGRETVVEQSGTRGHAEGYKTTVSGENAHAEGYMTKASNTNAHAEGSGTEASGLKSHAEGQASIASGENSHAEGRNSKATAINSHAEGYYTQANGEGSHVEGNQTIANGNYQHVEGAFNDIDKDNKYIHIAGNGLGSGTERPRSNAYTLDWNGNGWFAGEVTIGANKDKLATETIVDNKIAAFVDSAPEALDTLNELANALGNDENFSTTVLNEISRIDNKIIQSDWNQFDNNQMDYIKNRTHYDIEKKYELIIKWGNGQFENVDLEGNLIWFSNEVSGTSNYLFKSGDVLINKNTNTTTIVEGTEDENIIIIDSMPYNITKNNNIYTYRYNNALMGLPSEEGILANYEYNIIQTKTLDDKFISNNIERASNKTNIIEENNDINSYPTTQAVIDYTKSFKDKWTLFQEFQETTYGFVNNNDGTWSLGIPTIGPNPPIPTGKYKIITDITTIEFTIPENTNEFSQDGNFEFISEDGKTELTLWGFYGYWDEEIQDIVYDNNKWTGTIDLHYNSSIGETIQGKPIDEIPWEYDFYVYNDTLYLEYYEPQIIEDRYLPANLERTSNKVNQVDWIGLNDKTYPTSTAVYDFVEGAKIDLENNFITYVYPTQQRVDALENDILTINNKITNNKPVTIGLNETVPTNGLPSICDFNLIPTTPKVFYTLTNVDGLSGLEVPLDTTKGYIVVKDSAGVEKYRKEIPEVIKTDKVSDEVSPIKIIKNWSGKKYITSAPIPELTKKIIGSNPGKTVNTVFVFKFLETDFNNGELPTKVGEIPICSPGMRQSSLAKIEKEGNYIFNDESALGVFYWDSEENAYFLKLRVFSTRDATTWTKVYFHYQLANPKINNDFYLAMGLSPGDKVEFVQDNSHFEKFISTGRLRTTGNKVIKSSDEIDVTPTMEITIPTALSDTTQGFPTTATILNRGVAGKSISNSSADYSWIGEGDGVSDYTIQIQNKLDELHNISQGGIIYLGSGKYPISNSLIIYDNTQIIGNGQTIIEQTADNTHAVIWSGSNIVMRDLTIKLSGACTELTSCIFVNSNNGLNPIGGERDDRYPENTYVWNCSINNVTLIGKYSFKWENNIPSLTEEVLAYRGVGMLSKRLFFNFFDCDGLFCDYLYSGIYGGGGSNNYRLFVTRSRHAVYEMGGNNRYEIKGHTYYEPYEVDGENKTIIGTDYVIYSDGEHSLYDVTGFYDIQFSKACVYFSGMSMANICYTTGGMTELSNLQTSRNYRGIINYGRANKIIEPFNESRFVVGHRQYDITGQINPNMALSPTVDNALAGAGVWGTITSNITSEHYTEEGISLSEICRYPKNDLYESQRLGSIVFNTNPSEENIEITIDISDRPIYCYPGFWIQFDHRYVAEDFQVKFYTKNNNDNTYSLEYTHIITNNIEPVAYMIQSQAGAIRIDRIEIVITKALSINSLSYRTASYVDKTITYNPNGYVGIVNIGMPQNDAYGRSFLGECGGSLYGDVDLHNNTFKNLSAPEEDGDAVNKSYVDGFMSTILEKGIVTVDAEEHAAYGDELISSDGWVLGTGWSGDLTNGFTHTSGNTEPLTFTMPENTGTNMYQITFNSTVAMDTTNLFVTVGNSDTFDLFGQSEPYAVGIKSISNGDLVFIPSKAYTGTISDISIKRIVDIIQVPDKAVIKDSTGSVSLEQRYTKAGLGNIFLGKNTGKYNTTGDHNVGIGRDILRTNTSGFWNVGIGGDVLMENTVGSRNIGIGFKALSVNDIGKRNVAIGTYSLKSNTSGEWNVAVGADSMDHNIIGDRNVGVGFQAMYNNTTGSHNTGIGNNSLRSLTTGSNNVALGSISGSGITTGTMNVAIGYSSLSNGQAGKNNVAIGGNALYRTTGNANVSIGTNAGLGGTVSGYAQNVFIGENAGKSVTTENCIRNTFIGYNAGDSVTTGAYNICIGQYTDIPNPTDNYKLNIGDLIKGDMSTNNKCVEVDGELQINNLPTNNPSIVGRLWNDNGVVKISNGTNTDTDYVDTAITTYVDNAIQSAILDSWEVAV